MSQEFVNAQMYLDSFDSIILHIDLVCLLIFTHLWLHHLVAGHKVERHASYLI